MTNAIIIVVVQSLCVSGDNKGYTYLTLSVIILF